MSSAGFYASLPVRADFTAVTRPENFAPLRNEVGVRAYDRGGFGRSSFGRWLWLMRARWSTACTSPTAPT